MSASLRLRGFCTAAFVAMPGTAFAHPGHESVSGFIHGVMHPLSGIDHIVAMVSVGMLAALIGGRALWALPLAFLIAMALGGIAGMIGLDVPFVELGIVGSAVILAALVVLRINVTAAAALALASVTALLHGLAHGAELPVGAGSVSFPAGFLASTAILHLAGIGLVLTLRRAHSRKISRGLSQGLM